MTHFLSLNIHVSLNGNILNILYILIKFYVNVYIYFLYIFNASLYFEIFYKYISVVHESHLKSSFIKIRKS